ncbi:MAG: LysR substrate-binding domain-containing protein, partial [Myxococcaceae bacterium]
EQAALEVARALEGVERAPEGLVRLNTLPGLTDHFLGPFLERVAARYPKLRLQIDSEARTVDLTRNEADLAVRTVRPQSGDLVMTQLATVEYVLLASPGLAESLGVVQDPGRLPFIAWSPHRSGTPPARWLQTHAPEVEPVLYSDSLELHVHAARVGLGVALLPRQYLRVVDGLVEVALSGELRARSPMPMETLWLVSHRALRDVPRVAAVWEMLVEYFGERSTALPG